MNRPNFFFFLSLTLSSLIAQAQVPDTILFNGKVSTLNTKADTVQAIAVSEGRIQAIGTNANIKKLAGKQTQLIDLQGKTVIPGLIDSHIHAIRAALSYSTEVHWFGTQSISQAMQRLREAAEKSQPNTWLIVAGGWTEEQFVEKRRPTQAEIMAAAPNHLIYVQWMYGWALLNPAGLKALQINSDSDLTGGGKLVRDSQGQVTGEIVGGIVPLFDKLPLPTFEQKVNGTRKFFSELNRVGLTGVIDPGGFNMSPQQYAPLFHVWRNRELTIRVNYSYFSQKKDKEFEEFKELTQLLPMGFGDTMLRFNGIGERVTFGMYNNDTPTDKDKEEFFKIAKWAAENGITLTQHWQPNFSIHHLLDVLERVNKEVPIGKLRWSIAHLNDGTEESFQRMKRLGVGWAMQDAMFLEGDKILVSKGADALKRMPPINTAMRVGVNIGAGTDAHRVANYNPFIALRWMLDGKSASGTTLRGSEETPNRLQSLRMYTSGSAWLAHDDTMRGSLEVGKWADLAVLTKDYFSIPVHEIDQIHSVLTMVGGKVVHAEGSYSNLKK